MKHLNLIFNFLLLPFIFLGRVTDRAYAFPSGTMGTRKKNYSISSLFFTIIITSLLFFPNTIKASGDESGKNCNNAELVTIPYDVDSQEFERVSYNPTKDRTTFVSWFEFTPIADGTMHMYSENASVDIVGVLRDNDCSTNDNLLKDNTTGTNDIDMAYDVVSGTTYKLRLTHTISGDHTADTPPTFDLAIEMLPPPNTPNISIDPTSTSIQEGTASVGLTVNLSVPGNTGDIAVTYGGTCGASGTVNITQGSTSGSITVDTSALAVGDCTVILDSATGTNGQLIGTISPDSSTINITTAPTNSPDISFDPSSISIEEGTAAVDLNIKLNEPGNKGPITVNYTDNCNAGITGTISIPKGATTAVISIDTSALVENDTCTVVLNSLTGSDGQDTGTISPDTATISVDKLDFSNDNEADFEIVYSGNAYSKILLVGNTSLCRKGGAFTEGGGKGSGDGNGVNSCDINGASQSSSNNDINMINNDYDDVVDLLGKDQTTINSSGAKLDIPVGKTVKWAGLFWQGHLPNVTDDEKSNLNKVKFKHADEDDYTDIISQKTNWVYHGGRLYYQGFKEVTSQVNNQKGGYYWVGDIISREGNPTGGGFGAWSLVIVYEDTNEETRNTTIYHGYKNLGASARGSVESDLSGFRTPNIGTVDSTLFVLTGEGDTWGSGETASITNILGIPSLLSNTKNPNGNIFNSTITDDGATVTSGHPYYSANALGIDIDSYDVSSIMENNQSSTTIKFTSGGDGVFLGMYALETQLYVPDICYDYSVTTADGSTFTDIPTTNPLNSLQFGHYFEGANFNGEEQIVKVYIRSLEGDLQLQNVTVGVSDFNTTRMTFNKGEISFDGNFAYVPVIPTETTPIPFLPFGNDDGDLSNGGSIDADQNFYGKFYFNATGSGGDLDEYINISVKTHLDFGSGLVEFPRATDATSTPLERCPRNPVYDPTVGLFSVERIDATHDAGTETARYPLYTQIVEHPFEVSVVAQDVSTPGNTLPPLLTVSDIGVELELFKAGSFDNNASSGFDILCEDYDRDNILENKFVAFDNTPREYIDVLAFTPSIALRNAAFRVWYVTDSNGTMLLDDTCYDPNLVAADRDSCFADKYVNDGVRAKLDPSSIFCEAECVTGTTGCYECIKTTFGHPVCSRDNFAIRPAALYVKLDDGDSTNPPMLTVVENNVSYATPPKLAAGYPYPGKINAVDYAGTNIATKYYANFATTADPDNSINEAKFAFVDNTNTSCANISDLPIASGTIHIRDGVLIEDINITGQNAGEYLLSLKDNTWTIVDQISYEYMTLFDGNKHTDCVLDDATTDDAIFGCNVSSNVSGFAGRDTFTDMRINFRPYSYNLSNIALDTFPNSGNSWLYMNNLNDNKGMAVVLEGNMTALGYDDTVLTNYTTGCTADDVVLHIDTDSTPSTIVDEDGNTINIVQTFRNYDDSYTTVNNADNNASVVKANFPDGQNGASDVKLYLNLQKPYDKTINVADINFTTLYAYGVNEINIYADKKSDYQSSGNKDFNQSKTFFYAQVTPLAGTDGKQIFSPITTYSTALLVDTYCVDDATIGLNCSLITQFGDRDEIFPTGGGWYRTTRHSSTLGDGQITSLAEAPSLASLTISPNANINIDSNGSSGSIDITYPVAGRPVDPIIQITPDHWLRYNTDSLKNGIAEFTLHFLTSGLRWKGVGHTGNVVQTEPTNNNSQRLGW